MSTHTRPRIFVLGLFVAALALPVSFFDASALRADDTEKEKQAKKTKGQEKKQEKKKAAAPELPPEVQLMMEKGTPGKEHEILGRMVGSFDVAAKMYAGPGLPPMESKATATARWILGKRFVQETYRGEYLGMKFQGIAISGYDKIDNRYTSIWMDTMSTNYAANFGKVDKSGKVITYHGTYKEPNGVEKKTKMVITIHGRDKHVMEMFDASGDEPMKMMELVYTRKAAKEKSAKARKSKAKASE